MIVITSGNNPVYRDAQKLLRRKYRDRTGRYLLEGQKPLIDALETGLTIEKVFVCDGTETALTAELPREKAVSIPRKLFRELSDTDTSQGVIAVVRKRPMTKEQFIRETAEGDIIVLDRLQDPGNAGTIIRTAEAAGAAGVLCLKGSADIFSPKVVRSAAGSLFRVPVLTDVTLEEAEDILRSSGKQIVVTAMEGSENCFEAVFDERCALIIGNEGSGVDEAFIRGADRTVRIPMAGRIESLNAAVAAGILMYQITMAGNNGQPR